MELDLSDVVRIMKRWKWGIFAITLSISAVSIYVYKSLPKEYEVSAVLRVSGASPQRSIMGVVVGGGGEAEDYVELMKSREVLERVIEDKGLVDRMLDREELVSEGFSENDLVEIVYRSLRNELEVSNLGKSSLISVSFSSKDPKLSYDVVSGVVEAFMDAVEKLVSDDIRKKKEFLKNKIGEIYESYREKLEDLVKFQKESSIVSPSEELLELKKNLMGSWMKLVSSKLALDRSVEELRRLLESIGEMDPLSDVSNINDLSRAITELEAELRALRVSYPEDNVQVRAIKAKMDFLRSRIEDVMSRISKDPMGLSGALREISRLREEISNLREEIDGGTEIQKILKDEMNRVYDLESDYIFLQTQLSVLQNVISFTWQQYLGTMLDEISAISKVKLISPPRYTEVPKGVSIKIVGAIGLALGLFLGVLYAFWRENTSSRMTDHIVFSKSMGIEGIAIRRKKLLVDAEKLAVRLKNSTGTILIGGVSEGEGKTTLSLRLAELLSGIGRRVLLVDGDERRELSKRLGILESGGIKRIGKFDLLPSIPSDGKFPSGYDLVIVDSPPFSESMLKVSELIDLCDGAVVVLGEMVSSRSGAIDLLRIVGEKLKLVVFTNVRWLK